MAKKEVTPAWTYEDVRLCNCQECERELLGQNQPMGLGAARRLMELETGKKFDIAARLGGRPICGPCCRLARAPTSRGFAPHYDDPGPAYENAIRAMEDCGV